MVAFNNSGQGYFVFEDLDIEGALQDVLETIKKLQDYYFNVYPGICFALEKKIDKYHKVALYLERLKRGQHFN